MNPIEIKNLRLKLGLTQESLSEALGLAKLTMSQYETGYRRPNKTLIILFKILDLIPNKKAHELINSFRKVAKQIKAEDLENE